MIDSASPWQGLGAFAREGDAWIGEHDLAPLGPPAPPDPWPDEVAWPAAAAPAGRTLALDIETTGLGGAASVAFLVGLAWREGERVHVRQLLALDLPFEEAVLDRLATEFAPGDRLVTYNGDAFDLPFLRTRARFVGVRLRLPPALDVLAHTRRLYRDRDGSCRLGHLEATRLGHRREDDLPGALVPQVYYESLRREEPERLEPVLRHNALDLVATLGLLWQAAHDIARPVATISDARDLFGLYRSVAATGGRERAMAALTACLAADPPSWIRRQALVRLARLHREHGATDARQHLWRDAAAQPDAPWEHLVEWAKILEHERRDLAAAHSAAGAALARMRAQARILGATSDPGAEHALLHRLARLERRLERTGANTGA